MFNRRFFHLVCGWGSRREKLTVARWADIHFVKAVWRIPNTKSARPHLPPLPREAFQILERLPSRNNSEVVHPGRESERLHHFALKAWQLWCANFLFQVRRHLSEIREVEGVNPVSAGPNRAANQQRVVYLCSNPSSITNESQGLGVILFSDRHGLEMGQNVVRDDPRGLRRVDAWLHRKPRQCSVHLCDRVHANKPLVLPSGHPQQCEPGLRVMRVSLFRGGD